jgi:hypothetical protein
VPAKAGEKRYKGCGREAEPGSDFLAGDSRSLALFARALIEDGIAFAF